MKKSFLLLLISILLLFNFGVTVFAEGEDTDQTYTVTVVSGDYGTVNNKKSDTKTFKYGTTCYLESTFPITTTNSDYYYIGYHYSGHPEVNVGNFTVNEDVVLVASYGVLGNSVEYTVTCKDVDGNPVNVYTDENGNLVSTVKLRGPFNGKDVIVPAPYYENYWPEAYNYRIEKLVTGTEVNIVYHPNSELVGPTTTDIIYDDTVIYEEGGPAGGGAGGVGGGGTTPVGPQEEIVIPEPEVPQAEPGNEPGTVEPEPIIEPEPVPTAGFWETLFHSPWLLGGSIGGISLLMLFLFLLFGKKKRNAE